MTIEQGCGLKVNLCTLALAQPLKVDQIKIDECCRGTLRQLLGMSLSRGGVFYTVDADKFSEHEFHHLSGKGRIQVNGGNYFVLRSFVRVEFDGNVSKIGFVLNFDLE